MDPEQERLYRALVASQSDDERAAAWQAFARSGAADGNLETLRELFAGSDPSAVIDYLNAEAPERARQAASTVRREPT